MTSKNNRAPFCTIPSFVYHLKVIGEYKLKFQSRNAPFSWKSSIFVPCNLDFWQTTLINNRAPPLCYFKLWASFRSHQWIQTGVTVRKRPIWVKICDHEIWRMTLKNTTFLCYFKLSASFCSLLWIQKWSYGPEAPKLGQIFFNVCDLDLWPLTSDLDLLHGHHVCQW